MNEIEAEHERDALASVLEYPGFCARCNVVVGFCDTQCIVVTNNQIGQDSVPPTVLLPKAHGDQHKGPLQTSLPGRGNIATSRMCKHNADLCREAEGGEDGEAAPHNQRRTFYRAHSRNQLTECSCWTGSGGTEPGSLTSKSFSRGSRSNTQISKP